MQATHDIFHRNMSNSSVNEGYLPCNRRLLNSPTISVTTAHYEMTGDLRDQLSNNQILVAANTLQGHHTFFMP